MSNSTAISAKKDFSTMTVAELEKERGEQIITMGVSSATKFAFALITSTAGALIGLSTLATAPLILASGLFLATLALAAWALDTALKINKNIKELDKRIASKQGPALAVS